MAASPPTSSPSPGLFSGIFGQRLANSDPTPSVLAEWNKYASESSGQGQSDKVLDQMEEGSASMQRYLTSSMSKVTGRFQGLSDSLGTQMSSFQMPSGTQMTYFAALLCGGIVFLILAFTLFLPVIIIAPSKFAICFTCGSALVLSAFAALRGWRNQVKHMLSSDRLLFTLAYFGSMGGTLYAALGMHSYVLSLLCCAIQVFALLYYTLSYFPGGTHGLKYICYTAKSGIMQCFLAIVGR